MDITEAAAAAASSKRKSDEADSSNRTSSERGRGNAKRGRGGSAGRGNRVGEADAASGASDAAAAAAVAAVSTVALTPMQAQFQLFASYLDARNDRREAAVQRSRDLTRASKKLISSLQRLTHVDPSERTRLLAQARSKDLADLHRMLAATVSGFSAAEYFRFAGACSPGTQEFVEAASFLHFLETGELITHHKLEADIAATLKQQQAQMADSESPQPVQTVMVPLSDYILGITDIGGELMRYATTSVTRGEEGRATVSRINTFLRDVYALFQQLSSVAGSGGAYRELSKKLDVWLQSLQKLEALSYKLHIRMAEFPDSQMLDQFLAHHDLAAASATAGGADDGPRGGDE